MTRLLRIGLLLLCLLPAHVWAAGNTYWVSPTGTATNCTANDGEEDPGIAIGNQASNSPAYMTLAQIDASNCAGAGDTVMFKAGSYTGAHVQMQNIVPSGTTASQPSRILCEGDQTCRIAFNNPGGFIGNLMAYNVSHYVIGLRGNGFDSDSINAGTSSVGINLQLSADGVFTNVVIEGNLVRNHHGDGITMSETQPTRYYTNVRLRYNKVEDTQTPVTTANGQAHAIYMKTRDGLVEYNWAVGNQGYALQCWHIATNMVIRYNLFHTKNSKVGFTCQDSETNIPTNNQLYDNVFRSLDGTGKCIYFRGASGPMKAYNNTCINYLTFIETFNGAGTQSEFKNNVCTGTCTRTIVAGTAIVCGGTCTTTNPTVTASTHFKNASADDVSLISTSSLINSGLDVTSVRPCNGTCDIGAHETFAPSGATVNGQYIDITVPMTSRTPLHFTSGTTGWSVGCSGTGCGTTTVAAVSILSNSPVIVRLQVSGFVGGVCQVGQTITWGFNSTTGTVEDAAGIAGTLNQKMFTYSSQAVTNQCGAATSAYPAGYYLYYNLNDGSSGTTPTAANDDSGNAEHGTLSGGATWTTGKEGNGVSLTPDSTQYIAVPHGNALDPSTQSLTIAFWVKVTPGRESLNKSYFGAFFTSSRLFYITTRSTTWVLGIQASGDSSANGTSDLTVVPDTWQHLCLVANSATDTATLYKNGVAGTLGGVVKSYTSFTFPGNFELGRLGNVATGGGAVFDDFIIYQSVQDCNTLYRVREPAPPPSSGPAVPTGLQLRRR